MPYFAARMRLDIHQMPKIVGEARGTGPVIPGPERRLGDGHHAAAGHVLVIVGRAADAMDMRIDELHENSIAASVAKSILPISRPREAVRIGAALHRQNTQRCAAAANRADCSTDSRGRACEPFPAPAVHFRCEPPPFTCPSR